ncbi:MAG: hypothetical protein U0446_04135 [Dehalococcoidia bacterium]
MRARVTVITLAVADLVADGPRARAVCFFDVLPRGRPGARLGAAGVGTRPSCHWAIIGTEFEYGAVCFFDLEGGGRLALWPRASLAHDSALPEGAPNATER